MSEKASQKVTGFKEERRGGAIGYVQAKGTESLEEKVRTDGNVRN